MPYAWVDPATVKCQVPADTKRFKERVNERETTRCTIRSKALDFDDAVRLSERFEDETKTEVRERPMRCVIALSSLLVQAKMVSDKMDHEDVLRARKLAKAIIKADG